jgi:predicted CXXCH cytochrome family protein
MAKVRIPRRLAIWLAFLITFSFSLVLVGMILIKPAVAAPPVQEDQPGTASYAGSSSCKNCHSEIHTDWMVTRHANAFSSPIFQRDWTELSKQTSCLECHTTGFNPASGSYAEEGVTCESCHGPFQPNHPVQDMPVTPNADLCAACHKNTTDEWRTSDHNTAGIQCESCHNPHSQSPLAPTVTELCSNCHKDRGYSFTHGTHANSGLECSNCHMYTAPRGTDPIGGLVATGHTFRVGSDACIGCHQDTVHTRDEIVKLSGEIQEVAVVDIATLKKTIEEQGQTISSLETSNTVRLYTGLAQGAIVGLVTGGVAAWIVSRRIEVVEVEE